MLMYAGEKIRLFPTPEQESLFWKFSNAARWTYNQCLAHKNEVYDYFGVTEPLLGTLGYLQELRCSEEYSWLYEIPEHIPKHAVHDLESAYRAFFREKKSGHPRFKKKKQTKPSFYQRSDRFRVVDKTHIKLTGISMPVRVRPCNIAPNPKNIRVSFDGKYWFLSYCYQITESEPIKSDYVVGIDLGIKSFAVTSTGEVFESINKSSRVIKLEKRLKLLQRRLSRKYDLNRCGSIAVKTKNIAKLEHEIWLIYRRLRNIRNTYIHSVTTELVKAKPGHIVIEGLDVSDMLEDIRFRSAIGKQEFYKFRTYITYKCKANGVDLIVAERYFASSKICSACGHKHDNLTLADRQYVCSECGISLDRDLNAARNLANYGKLSLGLVS